ncbi:RNA_pol_Rpb2_6 domain-containing protein [Trichonephila clavata]|uniref:RNA_pol_Rpb2_6 domain-containing protein n=1 Tax=Trichonephila clavata TaxID=2740835 RepID=A0A8X6FPB4_TRICU|nr:RNA_pol_Rpb2_6 domain-containing protein [Trichonephila clavata]
MDSLSAYARQLTPHHQIVQEPVQDGISPHFALHVPHVVVSYMSFLGCTQEDGIVCRQDVNAFDCCRFYTIRIKMKADGLVLFHPVQGDADETSLVCTVCIWRDSFTTGALFHSRTHRSHQGPSDSIAFQ